MKRALLIRFGGLGDLLVALPSIRLIRGKYPEVRLTLACRAEYGLLLLETGIVDEILPEDGRLLLPLFSEPVGAKAEPADWLGSFELIMGWTHGRKGLFSKIALATSTGSAETHFVHADPGESEPLNRLFFRKTAESLGENGAPPIDDWAPLPTALLKRAEILNRSARGGEKLFAVIHPGSGSENKRWPLENFLQIIGRLAEHGILGMLVTGEAEEGMAAQIEKIDLPPTWTLLRKPGLSTLASLLSEAGLYIGNDSGVTHLAGACGADVVALFRREFASAWVPLGRVHLHIAASLSEISVESVWKTVASRLPNFSAYSQNS